MQTRTQAWTHILENIINVEKTSPTRLALIENDADSLSGILQMTDPMIFGLGYTDPDTGVRMKLSVGACASLRIIKAFMFDWQRENNDPDIDWSLISSKDFDAFRSESYDPSADLIPYRKFKSTPHPGSTPSTQRPGPTGISSADSFRRGIKKNKSDYKPFKNERYWDTWNRGFRATARTHDMKNVLDATYAPTTTDQFSCSKNKKPSCTPFSTNTF
jgi:hypothetical protein